LRFHSELRAIITKTKESWENVRQLTAWSAIRVRSRVLVLSAVFCLFAAVGLLALLMHTDRVSGGKILLRVLLSGGFAIGYAGFAMARRFRLFPVLIVAQVIVENVVGRMSGASQSLVNQPDVLQRQLVLLASLAMIGVIIAYSVMIHVAQLEGRRYFEARAEIALASEIHKSLVPPLNLSAGGFEIYGASVPSGEVGGDLVDVVERPGGWIGYVADVSGHGVQSGVLMAMFKAGLRGEIQRGGAPAAMLREAHRTLFPIKMGNMFVTVGMLEGGEGGRVKFASAGHPPILHGHKRSGTVSEYASLDAPVGIVEWQEFSEGQIQCEPGDVLIVLTDGFTEVFDKKGNEIGLEAVKVVFAENMNASLEEIFQALRRVTTDFGPQVDDQTLLLARYQG